MASPGDRSTRAPAEVNGQSDPSGQRPPEPVGAPQPPLAQVLDAVPHPVFWKDCQGVYLGCNAAFARDVGLRSAAEIVGKTDFDLPGSRAEAESYRAVDRAVLETGQPRRHIIESAQQAESACRWIDTTKVPLLTPDGRAYGVLGVYHDITERKQADDALARSEQRLRLATQSGRIGVYEIDLATGEASFDEVVGQIHGVEPGKPLTHERYVQEHVHPDDAARLWPQYRAWLASQDARWNAEYRILRPDGAVRWVHDDALVVRDAAGRALRTIGVTTDITERKQAEETLRKNEAVLRSMFEATPVGVGLLIDRVMKKVNGALCNITGYAEAELLGRHVRMLYPTAAEYERVGRELYGQMRAAGLGTLEAQLRRKDGARIDVLLCLSPFDTHDLAAGVTATVLDITERKRAAAEHDRLFSHSLDLLCVAGFDGRFRQLNPAWERTLGWSEAELLSRPWLDFAHPDDLRSTTAATAQLLAGQPVHSFENRYRCKDGSYRWLSWNSFPLTEEKQIFAVVRDVTEQKRAQDALRSLSARQEAILAAVPDIIMEVDAHKIYRWANRAGFEFFGDDVLGREAAYYLPDDEQATYEAVQPLFEGSEDVIYVESSQRRQDGAQRLLAWWCRVLKDSRGNVTGALSTARDITERRQAEQTLLREKAFTDAVLDSVPGLLYLYDREGHLVRWNKQHEAITGYSAEELQHRHVLDWYKGNAEDTARISAGVQKAIEEGFADAEANLITKSGATIPFYFTAVRLNIAGELYFTGIGLDLTQRRQAEEALRLNESRLEALLQLNQMAGATRTEIAEFALEEAVRLTRSELGYVAFANADETVLTMFAWSKSAMQACAVQDRPIEYPVAQTGLWSESVRQRRPIITNDCAAPNPGKKGAPLGHVPLRRHLNVPVLDSERIVIVAGVGNKDCDYDESDVRQLTLLMTGMWRIVQRKDAEEKLRASEHRFRSLYASMAEGVALHEIVRDEQGRAVNYRLIDVNPRYEQAVGLSAEHVLGKLATEAYGTPEPPYLREFARVLDTRQAAYFETYFAPLGRYFALSVAPLEADRFATIFFDITERKRAEDALKLHNERLRLIAGASRAVLTRVSPAEQFAAEARKIRATFGVDLCAIRTLEGNDLVLLARDGEPPEPLAERMSTSTGIGHSILETRRALSIADVAADPRTAALAAPGPGRYPFISYAGAPLLHDGNVIGILGLFTAGQRRDFAPTDLEHLQIVANNIAAAIINQRLYHQVTLQKEQLEQELDQRQRLEEQLRQSQKMEAIGQLAGGVAHDFNNILTAVFGHVELALQTLGTEHAPAGDLLENMRQIERSADRASALTRQLLAFSRRQLMRLEVLDLNATLRGLEPMLRRLLTENITLEQILATDLAATKADAGQLEQVVVNLVINACDAMRHGGRLTLETGNIVLDELYATLHPGAQTGEHVVLTVSDTGCGMDGKTRERIFEPFFTTKPKGQGTGLGLSMVYGIVKQAGGHVTVYSEPGRGSSFKVYLPAVHDPLSASKPVRADATPPRGTETLIICEDDTAVRELTARILAGGGYNVLAAQDAAHALQLATGHAGPIPLLLTDVIMPGMNGRQLSESLAVLRPGIRTLFVSGYTSDVIAHHGVLDDNVDFLEKPYSRQQLLQKIRDILDRAGHAPPA